MDPSIVEKAQEFLRDFSDADDGDQVLKPPELLANYKKSKALLAPIQAILNLLKQQNADDGPAPSDAYIEPYFDASTSSSCWTFSKCIGFGRALAGTRRSLVSLLEIARDPERMVRRRLHGV